MTFAATSAATLAATSAALTSPGLAAALLGLAVLLGGRPRVRRHTVLGGYRLLSAVSAVRKAEGLGRDPIAAASTLDVFAVCLSAGMAVSAAAAATAATAPPELGAMLRRAADLLALGADAEAAWSPPSTPDPGCEALARLARRSAFSGSALANGVAELAEQQRRDAARAAEAAAARAGVLIAGPLGLCFLPAFVVLGVVPVVAGFAGEVFSGGLL